MLNSHSLIDSDFATSWYKRWAKELKQDKDNLEGHQLKANKFWQNAVMVQALYERGLIEEGKTAVGFGVGRERLPALFAKHGVKVTATDQDYRTEKAKHWKKHELAIGAQSLNKLGISDTKSFKQNVSYQAVDMNRVPKKFRGKYDIVWSNCALGHLGSIENGLKFIVESAKCLKPGGYAVHTTEVNVISNNITLDNNPETVIFRPRDIHRLSSMLRKEGFRLNPLKLDFGKTKRDQRISISPQFGNDYSKLQVGGYILTQVVLIISRVDGNDPVENLIDTVKEQFSYRNNLHRQRVFSKENLLLQSIREYEKTNLETDSILPIKKSRSIKLSNKSDTVYLEYINMTNYPIFGMHDRLHTTKPIALATSDPFDRDSKFKSDEWFGDKSNRPSIALCLKDPEHGWIKADYIRPRAEFAYKLKLSAKGIKKGSYTERFVIVQEGNAHLSGSEVALKISLA